MKDKPVLFLVVLFVLLLQTSGSAQVLFSNNGDFPGGDVLRPSRSKSSQGSSLLYLGIEGGMNYNLFSQTINRVPADPFDTTPLSDSPLDAYKSGKGFSPFGAIFLDIPLSPTIGIQPKISYDRKKFGRKTTGTCECTDDFGTVTGTTPEDLDYTVTASYIGLGALLRFDLTPDWFLEAGPMIQFRTGNAKLDLTLSLPASSTCYFRMDFNNNRGQFKTISGSDDSIQTTKTRFAIEAGGGYKIPLSSTVFLVPQLRFQFFVTKFADDEPGIDASQAQLQGTDNLTYKDRMLHSIQLSLALMFKI